MVSIPIDNNVVVNTSLISPSAAILVGRWSAVAVGVRGSPLCVLVEGRGLIGEEVRGVAKFGVFC